MSTLLLRLAGPMQSWGTQSRFTVRDTDLEPSKSGVIGLLCAALGKPRREEPGDGFPSLRELAQLKMGVRVDRQGARCVDYHTAGGVHRRGDRYGIAMADGKPSRTVESRRYYLADADFLIGLEGDKRLLGELNRALAQPVWPLYLGRKSFVPGVPVHMPDEPPYGPGLRPGRLREVLSTYPWFRDSRRHEDQPEALRLVLETDEVKGSEVRRDVPVCFESRQFALRFLTTEFLPLASVVPIVEV
jgi:CRISPR system Cascade subunit CasD